MYIKLFEEFKDFLYSELVVEGGAAGHMMHPFDDLEMTFDDFRTIIDRGLSGNLSFESEPTEKTDGQNLWATIKDGDVRFARNKKESMEPMPLNDFINKFADHPVETVRDTFTLASKDLSKLLIRLPKETQKEVFQNGLNFINMELIYSKNSNIINYDKDVIQFHNLTKTDGSGNVIGIDTDVIKSIQDILSKVESNVGDTFRLIPPQIIKLHKDIDFDIHKDKLLKKLYDLQNRYSLSGESLVTDYHKLWWKEVINDKFPNFDEYTKDCLVLRWAFEDKKTLNIKDVYKKYPESKEEIQRFEKEDAKKYFKENIKPFEELFLEFGSIVLRNAENFVVANPTIEAERLKTVLKNEIETIKASNNEDAINKMIVQLDKLNSIGGIETLYPSEGIVFKYNGKLYKLTGAFAPLNQIMGILKYNR